MRQPAKTSFRYLYTLAARACVRLPVAEHCHGLGDNQDQDSGIVVLGAARAAKTQSATGRFSMSESAGSQPLPIVEDEDNAGDEGHKLWTAGEGVELRALETPLAQELAEMLLLQVDMKHSLSAMTLWKEKYASSNDEEARIIATSLFRDAITQFVGCFDTTAKFRLSAEEIYGHDPNGLSSFQWFKDVRDAYTSHKFGAFRQCVVGVALKAATEEVGIGQLQAIYRGQNKEDGDQLIGFVQTASNVLDAKVEQLRQQVLKYIEGLNSEEIAKLKPASARTLKMEEARFTRGDLTREKPASKR
jgi:hypothetical protein